MAPIIEAKRIGKKYNIMHHHGGYVALRDILVGILSSPLKFLKKKTRDVLGIDQKEEFWALSDVNFSFEKGEIIGVIGKNGAGKSTLLKILSQITPPTTGEIIIRGKVGSLLEVGTGFHPELTGRENIFLNGAILGMKRSEIIKKFDEIVAFANIKKFLDTPVKHYSSGMYVRLAFSIAAHMEPDILIIDEVLAVGDAEFQEKCLGKMNQISREEGRTVFFVSHNLVMIQKLCEKSILLENGKIKMIGETKDVIEEYTKQKNSSLSTNVYNQKTNNSVIKKITVTNDKGSKFIKSNDKIKFIIEYQTQNNKPLEDARLVITLTNQMTQQIAVMFDSYVSSHTWENELPSKGKMICESETLNISDGEYSINVDFMNFNKRLEYVKNALDIKIVMDAKDYAFKNHPDNIATHHIIKHNFKTEPLE